MERKERGKMTHTQMTKGLKVKADQNDIRRILKKRKEKRNRRDKNLK